MTPKSSTTATLKQSATSQPLSFSTSTGAEGQSLSEDRHQNSDPLGGSRGTSTTFESRKIGWRVLFVGGDPRWFHRLEGDVRCLQPDWSCRLVQSVQEAPTALGSVSYDAVVLDGHTPGVDGLLPILRKDHRRTIRLVRCDVLDRDAVTRWNGSGATPVQEDSDASALVASLKRERCLENWMTNPAIKKLLPLIHKLPASPELYSKVTQELRSQYSSMDTVAELISKDPVMSAKILQVANSAFFGLGREVTDTTEAVLILGTEQIRSLILLASIFSQYGGTRCPGFSPEPVWGHSVQVGKFARAIALGETKSAQTAEAAFTAGLLHDVGKLVLAGNCPEMYDTVCRAQKNKRIPQREAELEMLGTTHAELGACLLASWGLPLPILEAIAWHHQPEESEDRSFSLLTAVHAADAFANEGTKNLDGTAPTERFSTGYLWKIGSCDSISRWRQFCGLAAKPGKPAPQESIR